jgi:hypothetical protein
MGEMMVRGKPSEEQKIQRQCREKPGKRNEAIAEREESGDRRAVTGKKERGRSDRH